MCKPVSFTLPRITTPAIDNASDCANVNALELQDLPFDTPPGLQPHGFSVLRRGYATPPRRALPGPLYVLGRVVVPMQARSTVRAGMPADG